MTDKTEAVAQRTRDPMIGVVAALAAAISLLERTPQAKKAAPSDKMFAQMIEDYKAALERGRDFLQTPAEISTFNDTMPSSLNDACRRLDLAQEEIMKLRAQVDSAAAWLDQEITRAADQQRQSYARSGEHGQRQGERWHARQIALYEAKLKLTSTGGQK
jgi:hypothetical protein